jgi:hypothetical protein
VLYYLWKIENLLRLAARLKKPIVPESDDEDPIDVWGMTYDEEKATEKSVVSPHQTK